MCLICVIVVVVWLNQWSEGCYYLMVIIGNGQFLLCEWVEGVDQVIFEVLLLDDFVCFVDVQGL